MIVKSLALLEEEKEVTKGAEMYATCAAVSHIVSPHLIE
jgi:hypothetical protein